MKASKPRVIRWFVAPRKVGLGDVVGALAEPIARTSDALLKTNFKNCGGCRADKAALNAAVPNLNPFAKS